MPLVLRRTEGYPDSAICSCWLQNMFWNYFYWEPIGIFNILTDKSFRKKAVFLVIFPVISVYQYYPHRQLVSAARMLLTRSRLVSRAGRVATQLSVSISSNRLELQLYRALVLQPMLPSSHDCCSTAQLDAAAFCPPLLWSVLWLRVVLCTIN